MEGEPADAAGVVVGAPPPDGHAVPPSGTIKRKSCIWCWHGTRNESGLFPINPVFVETIVEKRAALRTYIAYFRLKEMPRYRFKPSMDSPPTPTIIWFHPVEESNDAVLTEHLFCIRQINIYDWNRWHLPWKNNNRGVRKKDRLCHTMCTTIY